MTVKLKRRVKLANVFSLRSVTGHYDVVLDVNDTMISVRRIL